MNTDIVQILQKNEKYFYLKIFKPIFIISFNDIVKIVYVIPFYILLISISNYKAKIVDTI